MEKRSVEQFASCDKEFIVFLCHPEKRKLSSLCTTMRIVHLCVIGINIDVGLG